MLLDLTDLEKTALIDLLVQEMEQRKPSPSTDLCCTASWRNSVLLLPGQRLSRPAPRRSRTDRIARFAAGTPTRVLAIVVALFRLKMAGAGADTAVLLSASHKMRGISANLGARLPADCFTDSLRARYWLALGQGKADKVKGPQIGGLS